MERKYGFIKGKKDKRDWKFSISIPKKSLPSSLDLRPFCPPIYDQGDLGSCTANAIGAAIHFELLKRKALDQNAPSRLFIYYNERVMEGTVGEDSGAEIKDGIKVVNQIGVCDETVWKYTVSKFAAKPTKKAFDAAKKAVISSYASVTQDNTSIKSALVAGYPVVFGFQVYSAFESEEVAKTGMVPMPKGSCIGGHAVQIVGYDDSKSCYIVRNSWGTDWGLKGYFYMPYAYVENKKYASDFWTIKM